MDNSDATEGHAMTPQEFAKLMGAYPQPAENPLPTYGGYMDNSPANFSFVEFNDYFGAEDSKEFTFLYHVYDKKTGEHIEESEVKVTASNEYEARGEALRMLEEGGLDDEEFELVAETFSAEDETEALERALYATMEALGECEADGGIDEREIEGLLAAHPIMEKFNAETFEAEERNDGSIVLTETELNECLPLQNGNYLFRDMELFLTGRKRPADGAKFMIIKRYKGKALEAITSYQNYLAKNKIRIHSPLTANKHPSPAFVKEAPYAGAGSLFSIGQNTGLEGFTTSELTTSSAIHGDFDEASLNYSGHQNFEVRAEDEDKKLTGWNIFLFYEDKDGNESKEAWDISNYIAQQIDEDFDYLKRREDGPPYDAEMEMIDDSNARIKNRFGDEIGMVAVDDHDVEDAVVEVSDGSDVIQEVIVSEAETKKSSMIPLALGAVAAIVAFPKVTEFFTKKEEKASETPELIESPDTGNLDPAQYEELVVESTGYAVDVIPQVLDGSFMGSRFQALPTERYVEYNEPGIGAHTDIALNRDEIYLEPEMAMVQASENVIKESQAPGQSPYNSTTGEENPDFDMRVLKETQVISLDPAAKPFIPQSMSGYTGNANTPPSVLNKMFNTGVLGQTPAFIPGSGDMGANHFGSRNATPNTLGLGGSVGGPLSDQVNANYTDGTTSMSLAQWSIENTVSQTSDTEAVVIDRSSGLMKRVRRV